MTVAEPFGVALETARTNHPADARRHRRRPARQPRDPGRRSVTRPRTRSLASTDRPRDVVPAPVRHQRQRRDPRRTCLLGRGGLRHPTRPAVIDSAPRTAAALVDRRDRSTRRTTARTPPRDRPRLGVRAHPWPGDRVVPPRQHRRRLAPNPALPATRLPHPRGDHGRTARRPRLRPHLQPNRVSVHPTRQRPRRHRQ